MTQEIKAIETGRLRLVSLSLGCLEAMLRGDHAAAGELGGFIVAPDCSLLRMPWIERRMDMILKDPAQHPWMYRAIVESESGAMVGHISFHHMAPDPDLLDYSANAVELGYTIEGAYRRRGYARESVSAMMDWAKRQGVRSFFLSIGPWNTPSLKLAESLGYMKIDEKMDEIDGLEYLFKAGFEDQ